MTNERIDLEGPRKRFSGLRAVLMLLVLLGMAWAYNRHFEGVVERIQNQESIVDETRTLPPEKLALLRDASRLLRDNYGVSLRIHVKNGPVTPPAADPDTLFIGLDTAGGQAQVVLPPLLAKALPPELAQRLSNGYFDPFFARRAWPEGLYSFVLAVMEALHDQH